MPDSPLTSPPPTLTLTISTDGLSVHKDPDPFNVGPPKNTVIISVVNTALEPHQVRLEKIKHLPTGTFVDPLSCPKVWLPLPGQMLSSTCTVKDKASKGRYAYVVVLDSHELTDPEIVVDPPPFDPGDPKRQTNPKKRAKAAPKGGKKRTAKKKTAKKKGAKKKAAKKKARRR